MHHKNAGFSLRTANEATGTQLRWTHTVETPKFREEISAFLLSPCWWFSLALVAATWSQTLCFGDLQTFYFLASQVMKKPNFLRQENYCSAQLVHCSKALLWLSSPLGICCLLNSTKFHPCHPSSGWRCPNTGIRVRERPRQRVADGCCECWAQLCPLQPCGHHKALSFGASPALAIFGLIQEQHPGLPSTLAASPS